MKQLTSTRSAHFSWHWRDGQIRSCITCEARQAWLLPEGGVVQETVEASHRIQNLPRAFIHHRNQWRAYLQRQTLDHFSLACQDTRLCIPGPPRIQMREPLAWTLTMGFTTAALGRRMIARNYRCPQPPSLELITSLNDMRRIQRIETRNYGAEAIVISGELLLSALSNAMDHVVQRTAASGQWIDLTPNLPGDIRQGFSDKLRAFRFLPAQSEPAPTDAWRALLYDPDEQALVCVRRNATLACRFILAEPLYRFATQLRFSQRESSLLIKDNHYLFPMAWLPGKS